MTEDKKSILDTILNKLYRLPKVGSVLQIHGFKFFIASVFIIIITILFSIIEFNKHFLKGHLINLTNILGL